MNKVHIPPSTPTGGEVRGGRLMWKRREVDYPFDPRSGLERQQVDSEDEGVDLGALTPESEGGYGPRTRSRRGGLKHI